MAIIGRDEKKKSIRRTNVPGVAKTLNTFETCFGGNGDKAALARIASSAYIIRDDDDDDDLEISCFALSGESGNSKGETARFYHE